VSRATPRDEGAGTVLVLGIAGALVLLAAATGVLGDAALARHRAEAAADLAALAAADVLLGRTTGPDGSPCAAAARIAAVNGADITRCSPEAATATVVVEVSVTPRGPAAGLGHARAAARAGPGT